MMYGETVVVFRNVIVSFLSVVHDIHGANSSLNSISLVRLGIELTESFENMSRTSIYVRYRKSSQCLDQDIMKGGQKMAMEHKSTVTVVSLTSRVTRVWEIR
jgi:hypothetical protein